MSKIKDVLLQAEESEDKQLEKWRRETEKMHQLQEQWDGIYSQIDGVVGKVKKGEENERI